MKLKLKKTSTVFIPTTFGEDSTIEMRRVRRVSKTKLWYIVWVFLFILTLLESVMRWTGIGVFSLSALIGVVAFGVSAFVLKQLWPQKKQGKHLVRKKATKKRR
jgi:uncharacterized membrane protein